MNDAEPVPVRVRLCQECLWRVRIIVGHLSGVSGVDGIYRRFHCVLLGTAIGARHIAASLGPHVLRIVSVSRVLMPVIWCCQPRVGLATASNTVTQRADGA